MTGMAAAAAIISALDLPARARVDSRVPKKMLAEQGAPTTADKRAIQDGIDEIAMACGTEAEHNRHSGLLGRIPRLFGNCRHRRGLSPERARRALDRADPPRDSVSGVVDHDRPCGVGVSGAPKRAAQNEGDKVVVERIVVAGDIDPNTPPAPERAFLDSLALAHQPARDLSTVYDGWLARIEALVAARLSGRYEVKDESGLIDRRRTALEEHARLAREATQLRAQAARAKQISQRVHLNQKSKRSRPPSIGTSS